MNKKILNKIVCMLAIIIMLSPFHMVIANETMKKPDLLINLNGTFSNDFYENMSIPISADIWNDGNDSAFEVNVVFYIDNTSNVIYSEIISCMNPGTNYSISFEWNALSGNHSWFAKVDPLNKIKEHNETNNQDTVQVYVMSNNSDNQNNNIISTPPEIIAITYGDNIKYEHLSNGVIRSTIPYPTVYNENNDQWEPANLILTWNDEIKKYKPKKSKYDIGFAKNSNDKDIFKSRFNDEWITYSIKNSKKSIKNSITEDSQDLSTCVNVSSIIDNNKVTFEQVYDETDIVYDVFPYGIKETFVLHSPPKTTTSSKDSFLVYDGELEISKNLTLFINGEEVTDKKIRTDKNIEFKKYVDGQWETICWFVYPFAYDSNKGEYNQTECFYSLKINNQKIKFSIEIPLDWLLDSERVYPVFIDPTIETLNPLKDTYSRSYYKRVDTVYGAGSYMKVNPYSGDKNRAYLEFDLTGIPSNSNIISADFRYNYYDGGSLNGRTHDFYKISSTWDESTLTWNNQPSYDTSVISSYVFPSSYGWIEADLTDYVQDKIDGETDYGFMIKDHDEGNGPNNQPRMRSRESGIDIPELVVEYVEASGSGYSNDFSTDPSLQGSNYNDHAKADWSSINERIDWVGRRETNTIDRYFTFSGISMSEPEFSCDFRATSYIIVGQQYGLQNKFRLQTPSGMFIGFRHTMDSDSVDSGNRGIRGEFDNGGSNFVTDWILINDDTNYNIEVYIEDNVGKIKIGSTTEIVNLTGDFSGSYNSFHFILGGVSAADDSNGASGWFDNLIVGTPSGGQIHTYTEDFEDEIGLEWSCYYTDSVYGRIKRSTYSSHSGSYSCRMDVTSSGNYNLNEFILHVKMDGASYLNLDFFTRSVNDETDPMSDPFVNHYNADGVAVSTDRINWVPLWSYVHYSYWNDPGPFDIGDEISISGDVYIKFQQYDNYAIGSDGILWDDITLEADGTIDTSYEFIMPEWGGAMVHSDPHLTDSIDLQTPPSFGNEWSIYSSTPYGRNIRNDYSANAGNYSWQMDNTYSGDYNLNELILHVGVNGASYLNLNFKTREYGDEQDLMLSSFIGHTYADGIAVSNDGNNWERLWGYPETVNGWTSYGPYDINNEISITGDVYIKFQQYDNYQISSDGILWDDITLVTDGEISYGAAELTSSYYEDFEMKPWYKFELDSEKSQIMGNGMSGNGEIAACPFANWIGPDNLIVYDYNGNRLWRSGSLLNGFTTSSTPMVSVDNKIVIPDNFRLLMIDPFYNDEEEYIWKVNFPFGDLHGTPFSPTFTDNGAIILPMSGLPTVSEGSLYAYNFKGEWLGKLDIPNNITLNSACCNGNRIYLLTKDKWNDNSYLRAIYVDPTAEEGCRLIEKWNYHYIGQSQASPVYIDGTLYFDVYNSPEEAWVYAIHDYGTYGDELWDEPTSLPYQTLFSMSADPRGGVWYSEGDMTIPMDHNLLHRIDEDTGNILETIDLTAILDEGGFYLPRSVTQICGDETNPIMIISANDPFNRCYVLAIDLELGNNKLLWHVRINSLLDINNAGGQYTILLDKNGNNPRIVFAAYFGGIFSVGH